MAIQGDWFWETWPVSGMPRPGACHSISQLWSRTRSRTRWVTTTRWVTDTVGDHTLLEGVQKSSKGPDHSTLAWQPWSHDEARVKRPSHDDLNPSHDDMTCDLTCDA